MSAPEEWIQLLEEAYTGLDNGAIKVELRRKWGQGLAGQAA